MKSRFTVIVALLLLSFTSCKRSISYDNFAGFVQGTTYSMIFENNGKLNPQELKSEVEKILHDFDMSLSLYVDSSILSKVNRNEDVIVDAFFTEAFKKSAQITEMTDGAFDITVGPLMDLWGFTNKDYRLPNEKEIQKTLKLVGMNKIIFTNNDYVVKFKFLGMKLDLGAIAKGYAVDCAVKKLKEAGIKSALINAGGQIFCLGD
ncbi:MAG: FAD:protein FMN transferase, partial [Bacteroidia bacterium]|nr:FAD:protein FMN transferase [Bacteroidia bacterium]